MEKSKAPNKPYESKKITKDIKPLQEEKHTLKMANICKCHIPKKKKRPVYRGIPKLLKEYNINRSQLGREFGYDQGVFYKIIKGKHPISNKLFIRLLETHFKHQKCKK